ncbi:BA14K family protein [Neorhizobium galegae]|uniref:BA14K family protein n=1 Tax=Neorhizobium galegae TaxID=399 RepID=UPI001F26FFF8|nr:BA14K family protein [Neorhizobium galegae]MCQ1572967.1 BA14K family protein [Neorhizobium galegae]UIK06843.1 BA14K family protein [Neorhizobium galegae]
MKKKLAVAVLSLIAAFSGVAPAQAFPSIGAPRIERSQDIQQVQYWRDRDGWEGRRYYRDRYDGDRRYRRHRRGPDAGAIIGGLALGAIIGGALAQPRYTPRYAPRYAPRYYAPRRYVGGNSHVNWCYARYRSYRAYDNTFQPYYGPRQQCYSPY